MNDAQQMTHLNSPCSSMFSVSPWFLFTAEAFGYPSVRSGWRRVFSQRTAEEIHGNGEREKRRLGEKEKEWLS